VGARGGIAGCRRQTPSAHPLDCERLLSEA
jgi:hypothetical protein